MNMRFIEREGGSAIILTDKALSTMAKYKQLNPKAKEAGGQLFAKFDGADTIIVEATPPNILDKRTRHRFKPNRMLQRLEIYNRHRKGLHFVGDWHTHPEKHPNPSNEDVLNMKECFTSSKHELRTFIMIVVGSKPAPAGLYIAIINGKSVCNLRYEEANI